MNTKTLVAALLGGIALSVVSFLFHGLALAPTYVEYDQVFAQEQASPAWYLLTAVVIALPCAYLFGRTRNQWAAGVMGGALFGAIVGCIPGFTNFYWPLVIEGFPYFLSWCWFGTDVISFAAMGLVFAMVIKRSGS